MDNNHISSNYEIIANAFKVIDISHRIFKFAKPYETALDVNIEVSEPTDKLIDLWENGENNEEIFIETDKIDERFCIVKDEEKTYGYIHMSTPAYEDIIAKDAAEKIFPDDIVPGSMPLLDLIHLFNKKRIFFVLVQNEIKYVVFFNDLDKLPVKLCIFSLFIELESHMIQFLTYNMKLLEFYIKKLPCNRMKKAVDLLYKKYDDKIVTTRRLLLCTNFIDKWTIIKKNDELFEKLDLNSKKYIRG